MLKHLRANLWLLGLTVLLCCVIYPVILLVIGQTFFPAQASGSLVYNSLGKPIGSRLIAQPFTGDEYFQPRPSAVSYNAAASGASNWGANNYLLRDRVARQLGPIVKYRGGANAGKLVGPDVETWFQKDRANGKPGIVAQWAAAHPSVAQNWVKADPANAAYITAWQATHRLASDARRRRRRNGTSLRNALAMSGSWRVPQVSQDFLFGSEEPGFGLKLVPLDVAAWVKANPDTPHPRPDDLAVPFFTSFSHEHPSTFPSLVEHKTADGKTEKRVEPASAGTDIQSTFFDLWRQEHADVDLEPVPADMVMASGSGLDPHITLKNARYQLDRVVAKWASITRLEPVDVRRKIESLLTQRAEAPFGGLVGVELINVLEVNLELQQLFRPQGAGDASK